MTTKLPSKINAALALVRSIGRAAEDKRLGGDLETARFNLWNALESGDNEGAPAWLRATAVVMVPLLSPDTRALADAALDDIAKYVESLSS